MLRYVLTQVLLLKVFMFLRRYIFIRMFHFSPFLIFKMRMVLSDRVLSRNYNPQILIDYDVILMVHSSKVSKLSI